MTHHLICLTVDTDPDGLCGRPTNRAAHEWHGLDYMTSLSGTLTDGVSAGQPAPVTWFIRADGQLRLWFGSACHLLLKYEAFWAQEAQRESELAWHPHLYRQDGRTEEVRLLSCPAEACNEIEAVWRELQDVGFRPTSFRNGEAWHSAATMDMVERLGIRIDSSAVPGREGGPGHPMNWLGAPTQPYFPSRGDIRQPGPRRSLLEIPMSTWAVRAPWDQGPATRYIDPAVHESLFAEALRRQLASLGGSATPLRLWVLVLHPEEVAPSDKEDGLISHSMDTFRTNMRALIAAFEDAQETWEFTTIGEAAKRWLAGEQPVQDR